MSPWCKCGQNRASCVVGALLLLAVTACERSASVATPAAASIGLAQMEREVLILSARVSLLESQLQQERHRAAKVRQEASEQAARLAALENQAEASIRTPQVANPASSMQLEAELR